LKVALTGSIAVGKNYVLQLLHELGCHTIGADHIAREVVRPCDPAYHEIVREFGAEILTSEGTLDRGKLGSVVFNDAAKRERLNRIVHPRVIEQIDKLVSEIERYDPNGIVVVSGALFVESGAYRNFDKVIVVFCDEEKQIERLIERDGFSREEALKRIRAQLSSEEKRRYADFEIDTSGGFEATRAQVEALYRRLQP